ncbi:MAG TPA: LysE family translocator [Streptosporangiaceae bacterium]|nr:LysE family translocator [Streptosporangiaceae bacterium]
MIGVIATFTVVALLLSVLPGPDTLLVLRAGLRGGQRYGTAAGLGCAAGSLIWGSAAAVGLATLLERSAVAFEAVKLAGAVYLIILGIRALWDARRPGGFDAGSAAAPQAQSAAGAFLAGLTNDLLNPKMGLFYVAVIPQIVPHTMPIMSGTLMFAGVDTAVAALYMATLAAAAGWAVRWLRRTRVRRAMEGTTGLCMVGLGASIALDHSL